MKWKYKRGKGWRKWVCDELKAWVTWWADKPSLVHYGSDATYRGTIAAAPEYVMTQIEERKL